jgi:hypothetical protein
VADNAVSEPDIRNFCGSLGANKAAKGVFVTISYFTKPAEEFAERHPGSTNVFFTRCGDSRNGLRIMPSRRRSQPGGGFSVWRNAVSKVPALLSQYAMLAL